ncbi:MAG TPA: GntR family transcriptional regulator [Puia sp.]|nr:GntR family transcriptional regulator [Puia sp.]
MNLTIDHGSKVPLHVQVEELLRNLIEQPKYKGGTFLPREVELANRLGVSRNTVRQATNKLEYEGLLIRKKGVGTRVAPPQTMSTSLNNWQSFTKEMQSRGIHVVNLSIKTEKVKADSKMAVFFNIKPGTWIIKLSKLKGVGDDPIVYFESYFHPKIMLGSEDDLNKPLYDLLEEKYGITVQTSKEHISACMAGEHARRLKVSKQAPILFRERFVYDLGSRPVEYGLAYYRSDKFTYSIEIRSAE